MSICLQMLAGETMTLILKDFRFAAACTLFALSLSVGANADDVAAKVKPKIRVAVFKGVGVGKSVANILDTLSPESDERFQVRRITTKEILDGHLNKIDVLIHPGGSGSKQGGDLGEQGREAVRSFVRKGGGFLGVCAGCYLATNDYAWSLGLIDAKVIDRKHWNRGTGMVQLKFSNAGATLFAHESDEMEIYYGQGPLLGRPEWDDLNTPNYESLAIYDSEIATKGAPKGIMRRTSAIVRARFGDGRVFCFSPHPELTDCRDMMIRTAVTWLVDRSSKEPIRSNAVYPASAGQ